MIKVGIGAFVALLVVAGCGGGGGTSVSPELAVVWASSIPSVANGHGRAPALNGGLYRIEGGTTIATQIVSDPTLSIVSFAISRSKLIAYKHHSSILTANVQARDGVTGEDTVTIVDGNGANPTDLPPLGVDGTGGGICWSFDNQKIFIVAEVSGQSDIYSIDLRAGEPAWTKVTNTGDMAMNSTLACGVDGSLYCPRALMDGTRIYIFSPSLEAPFVQENSINPCLSPDTQRMAYQATDVPSLRYVDMSTQATHLVLDGSSFQSPIFGPSWFGPSNLLYVRFNTVPQSPSIPQTLIGQAEIHGATHSEVTTSPFQAESGIATKGNGAILLGPV